MKLEDPNSDRMQKDYEQSDVEQVFRKAQPHSYDEMIQWLEREGDNDRRLAPGEVANMTQDLSRLKERKKEFISDPAMLYQELKR